MPRSRRSRTQYKRRKSKTRSRKSRRSGGSRRRQISLSRRRKLERQQRINKRTMEDARQHTMGTGYRAAEFVDNNQRAVDRLNEIWSRSGEAEKDNSKQENCKKCQKIQIQRCNDCESIIKKAKKKYGADGYIKHIKKSFRNNCINNKCKFNTWVKNLPEPGNPGYDNLPEELRNCKTCHKDERTGKQINAALAERNRQLTQGMTNFDKEYRKEMESASDNDAVERRKNLKKSRNKSRYKSRTKSRYKGGKSRRRRSRKSSKRSSRRRSRKSRRRSRK